MTTIQKSRRRRGNQAHAQKKLEPPHAGSYDVESLTTELMLLPDGQILVHNLTQPFAELLHELNPDDGQISSHVTRPPLLRSGAASHLPPHL